MYFSEQALAQLQQGLAEVPAKKRTLQQRYIDHRFEQERATEFSNHGFIRRVATMARCIENVFALIPPEQSEPVSRDTRRDAEINIQASFFNTFAAVDNLAWVWVVERNVRQPNGACLPENYVGLRRANRMVREALPRQLRQAIERHDEWFAMIDNYRHALAHRIPLYIPPYCVLAENEARHNELDTLILQAVASGELKELCRFRMEQAGMRVFQPVMQHSFGERARSLVFHPQLLANFNTVDELGNAMLDAIQA